MLKVHNWCAEARILRQFDSSALTLNYSDMSRPLYTMIRPLINLFNKYLLNFRHCSRCYSEQIKVLAYMRLTFWWKRLTIKYIVIIAGSNTCHEEQDQVRNRQ